MNKEWIISGVESAGEDDIENLMNDSDNEFIAEEEITQAAGAQDTSLTTPISQKRKKKTKKKHYRRGPKK